MLYRPTSHACEVAICCTQKGLRSRSLLLSMAFVGSLPGLPTECAHRSMDQPRSTSFGRVQRPAVHSTLCSLRAFTGQQVQHRQSGQALQGRRGQQLVVYAIKDGESLQGRKLRVAVVGGGPGGACTADTLAKGGIETYLIERKLDNCKVQIPL